VAQSTKVEGWVAQGTRDGNNSKISPTWQISISSFAKPLSRSLVYTLPSSSLVNCERHCRHCVIESLRQKHTGIRTKLRDFMLRGVTSSYVLCMQIEKHRYNLLCHGLANTESYILKSKQDGRKVHLISYISFSLGGVTSYMTLKTNYNEVFGFFSGSMVCTGCPCTPAFTHNKGLNLNTFPPSNFNHTRILRPNPKVPARGIKTTRA
jgi:hypothetical protein